MKFVLLVLALLVGAAAASPLAEEEYQFLFTRFTAQHNKVYETHAELFRRFNIFKKNLDFVNTHMSNPDRSFDVAMNKFGDLSNDEFKAMYNNFKWNPNRPRRLSEALKTNVQYPGSVDWVQKGKVTPVKNQGQCGSCWSFSTTGAVESANAIFKGTLNSLSEQELVDCSGSYGNMGCNGGLMDQAFEFIEANGGLCGESAYPYEAVQGSCRKSSCSSVSNSGVSTYTDVTPNSEDALATAVAQQPVAVAVDAGGEGWQFYSGGVMDSTCGTQLDHGVLAAGYGADSASGELFWLVKNSWGSDWGENGYIRLVRHTGSGSAGQCGITLSASYPTP